MDNQLIIDNFKQLIKQIKFDFDNSTDRKEKLKHSFRLKQIQNALHIIEKVPTKIIKGEQLKNITGIGEGTIKRINEIIQTGKLEEVKVSGKEILYLKEIKNLSSTFGIGRKKAYELITKYNIHSIDDLKKTKIDLPENIKVGLKYYDEYEKKIPRSEMIKYEKKIKQILNKLDKNFIGTICGSYRRGKLESGDIDLLIVHPKIQKMEDKQSDKLVNVFKEVVNEFKKKGLIIDSLTENYKNKFMGFCKLKNKPVRRIDIRFLPFESFYTALLYFTGSGEFNRKMRMIANSFGYTLNEYGLFDKNKLIKVSSEKDIFDKLNMEYVDPDKRN